MRISDWSSDVCSSDLHWARELIALGHDVRLMPAQYVKPYVKRGKNDAADAEAICEAVTRPTMRFVAVKTPEQQSVMMLGAANAQPTTHPAVDRNAGAPLGVRARGTGWPHRAGAPDRERFRPRRYPRVGPGPRCAGACGC